MKRFIYIILATATATIATADPWYRDYFSMVTLPHEKSDADLEATAADAFRASRIWGGWYGYWFIDRQKATPFFKESTVRMKKYFEHDLIYHDGGEIGDLVLFTGPDGNIQYDAWNIQKWDGELPLTAHWFGIDTFFKKENPFPYPNSRNYGLKPFTYPDGTLPDESYEVLGRRNLSNELDWNEPFCNKDITDEQAEKSGLAKISKRNKAYEHMVGRNGWITNRLMTQDYTNPQLRDYQAWEIGMIARDLKPSGFHIDNFGDNNLYRTFDMGLGVWSEHTFREYMKKEFSKKQLQEMGIAAIDTFDIKEYIKARKLPGKESIYDAYDSPEWKDDLIFKCYQINHAIESAGFHKPKYAAVKEAAKEGGFDCLVAGNLIPIFPGFTLIKDYLDICHFEWPTFYDYEPTRRKMGLPPEARSGYITRLASAIGNEKYSAVSLYVSHEQRGEKFKNLYLAQGFEALGNRAVIDYGHQYLHMFSPGTPETAGIFNRFLDKHRKALSRREFVADIGIVYDQWAEIAGSTACQLDVNEFFNEYGGWCDYMQDTQRQWNVVPSSDLEFEKIKHLPMLILPSALSLTNANFRALKKYLKNGGRVLATGNTGQRFGPEGHLMKRPESPLKHLERYANFQRVAAQPAAPYWLWKKNGEQLALLLEDLDPVVETDAEIHVGVNLSRSLPGEPKSLSLDLNNNNFDPATDTFTATKPFNVSIRMPADFKPPFEVSVSELGKETRKLEATRKGDRLSINFEPFEAYQLIQIVEKK